MKLRNKKTREIGWLYCDHISIPKKMTVFSEDKDLSANHWDYKSLAELNEEWEDYEEPKEYWHIFGTNITKTQECLDELYDKRNKEIGNYFETKEEAEKAVEKLKALAEAKEDGLKIKGYYYNHEDLVILADIGKCNKLTLDTLFGKEID